MKKILVFFSLLVTLTRLAYGQDSTKPFQKHPISNADIQQLGLNAEQQQQLNTISENTRLKRTALQQDSTLTTKQRKKELHAQRKESKKQIDALLTAQQKQKLQQLIADRNADSPHNLKHSPNGD